MSNCYYLIDRGSKTFYDLGKGNWYALNEGLETMGDFELLKTFILNHCYNIDSFTDVMKQNITNHVKDRLAPDLFDAFGKSNIKDLIIVDDGYDDLTICKAKQYKCVGLRYGDKKSDKYQEDLKFANRHLDDTGLNKRLYNPDDYIKYPEWNQY